jgi:hypothetical protein
MPTYRLTGLTEKHLRAILKATEFFERISMGQFNELLDVADPHHKLTHEEREPAETYLALARQCLIPELKSNFAYWSIRSSEVHDDARICYDFLQVVRNRLAWDNHPEGGWTYDFDAPLRTSSLALLRIEPESQESSEVSLDQSAVRKTAAERSSTKSGSKVKRGSRKVKPDAV